VIDFVENVDCRHRPKLLYAPAEEAHGQRIHGVAGVHGDRYPQDAALTKRGEVAFGV
jgi:hypothetical protein